MKKKFLSVVLTLVMIVSFSSGVAVAQLPDDLGTRVLTDVQLQAMLNSSAQQLRTNISTVADAIAYLDMRYPTLWMSYHLRQGTNSGISILRSGEDILSDDVETDASLGNAGRSDIVTALTYLLDDDCDISSIYGFWHFGTDMMPIKSVNAIKSGGKYYIFDPVLTMRGDEMSRNGNLLPEAVVTDLDEYANLVIQALPEIESLYQIPKAQQITFTDQYAWVEITSPQVEPFYANEEKRLTKEEYEEQLYGHIKPENIDDYKLSKLLGGVTMTAEEAKQLVGQPVTVLKKSVQTAGDLLLYMLSSRMLLLNGDSQIVVDGYEWHFNPPVEDTIALNLGNCGRMANAANYLLEGDYDEIGFILHSYYPGDGGGHVYNYIVYEGKTYIVDFSSYLFTNYDVANEFNFIALDDLEDYGTRWTECYGGLAAIISHTSPGTHLPNVWYGDGYYFPEDSEFTILLETPDTGYEVRTLACPSAVPDWKKPQGGVESEPEPTPAQKSSFDGVTWTLSPNYSGKLNLYSDTNWIIDNLFCKDETGQIVWNKGERHITVTEGSGTFTCIVKLVNSGKFKYIGVEKLIGVNIGTFSNSTWYVPDNITSDAVLSVIDWNIENVLLDADNGMVDYDDTSVTVNHNADSFDAIIKLKHTIRGQIKYIGISKD